LLISEIYLIIFSSSNIIHHLSHQKSIFEGQTHIINFSFLEVLGIKFKVLHILEKCLTTETQPQLFTILRQEITMHIRPAQVGYELANVAQADLEHMILLPLPSECWDYRHVNPCLALIIF
jgi:hypothetical protein